MPLDEIIENEEKLEDLDEFCCKKDSKLLINYINSLKQNINETEQNFYKQQEIIKEINNNIQRIKLKENCIVCCKYNFDCINIPCGHPVCYACVSLKNCIKCKQRCQVIQMAY